MGYWHLASGDLPLAQRGQLQRAYAHGGGGAGRRRGHGGARWGRLGRTRTGEESAFESLYVYTGIPELSPRVTRDPK